MNEDEIREIVRDELSSERREQFSVREIIRDEMEHLVKTDRFTFQRTLQILDGRHVQLGGGVGTKIGTSSSQKLGFWGAAPVSQGGAISNPSLSSVSGTGDDSTINGNFSAINSAIQGILSRMRNTGDITS